jgi:hypothetical protein
MSTKGLRFAPHLVFVPLLTQCMIPALKYHIFKPQNLHDWDSISSIFTPNLLDESLANRSTNSSFHYLRHTTFDNCP